ncbi:hypothetical protein NW762_006282 [Fusarium torreyae]|uniref:GH16 domain-containing protein n=1 Tax=Fusarium torreyae TaxID=1237075 RepID=A0A9W8VE83_9HYPO|nr:hypothetical protein NW762_006282 [Fusarium torreyae]
MSSTRTLFASLLAIAPLAIAQDCDCYVTEADGPQYFTGHSFFDFRSLSQYAGVPGLIDTLEGNAQAGYTSAFFSNENSQFRQFWGPQNWWNENEEFPMQNTYNNLYIEDNNDASPSSDTWLTMRTARHNGFQTASEFESILKYQHVSMRMYARTKGSPGACTAMFTYLKGNTLAEVQEADIEILTKDDPIIVHYTNQPSYTDEGGTVEGAHLDADLPDGLTWSDWAKHTIDWTPDATIWRVNDKENWRNSFQVPRDPAQLSFNAWSDGKDWTGTLPVGGAAYQQIQWIEILHGRTDADSCSRVCSVDGEPGELEQV